MAEFIIQKHGTYFSASALNWWSTIEANAMRFESYIHACRYIANNPSGWEDARIVEAPPKGGRKMLEVGDRVRRRERYRANGWPYGDTLFSVEEVRGSTIRLGPPAGHTRWMAYCFELVKDA